MTPEETDAQFTLMNNRMNQMFAELSLLRDIVTGMTTTGTTALNCGHINALSIYSAGQISAGQDLDVARNIEVAGDEKVHGSSIVRGNESVGGSLLVVSDIEAERVKALNTFHS